MTLMFLLDESDSEHNPGIDMDPEQHAQKDRTVTSVMDDPNTEDEELSDTEIERQQEELYHQEQAQILQAERLSNLDDWVPHASQKKWKAADYGGG